MSNNNYYYDIESDSEESTDEVFEYTGLHHAEVIFEYMGEGCAVPKDVTIVRFHPSVVEVEEEVFQYCNKLKEVIFNDGLQKIGYNAFWSCKLLSSITLPSTVTEIGSYAFYGCRNLREATLNWGLQKIGESAFQDCTSLSFITFPSTVIEIGEYAFYYCSNLREVVFLGVPREIGVGAFSNCTALERSTFLTISTRLDNLIQTGHWDEINNRVGIVRGVVERSRGNLFRRLFLSAQTMRGGNNWNAVRRNLDDITRVISYYELKEATSMIELALWKFKLDQVDKANPVPRKKCRMDVPGPVKDIILAYLR